MKKVYIIGSKGIPAKYGGFETFVDKLTAGHQDENCHYVVACMRENSLKSNITEDIFNYQGATCFNVDVPNIGPAKAVLYDLIALNKAITMAKENNDVRPIFYVLACRIGPFIAHYKKRIKAINGRLFVNPDGHEWLREKWAAPIRKYWKFSERLMIKHSDLIICDSITIEKYIQHEYSSYTPKTTYIAYGTDIEPSNLTKDDTAVRDWFSKHAITEKQYYLIVGRFVPENNYEAMIKGFMQSDTKKNLVIITNVEQNKFYQKLKERTAFDSDKRIKFVGTLYQQDLLRYVREQAFAYLHGHEVGGTNPSLLEALSSTAINLLLDVGFNREVGQNGALYWGKNTLSTIINETEKIDDTTISQLQKIALTRMSEQFSWQHIIACYHNIFLEKQQGDN